MSDATMMSFYDSIYRTLLFPWQDRKLRIRECLRELEDELALPSTVRDEHRLTQFQQLCLHAATTTRYWRDEFANASIENPAAMTFADLPRLSILEKQVVREQLDDLSSDRFPPESRIVSRTGGSTAAPTQFYLNAECRRKRVALRHLHWKWMGRSLHDRTAKIWGAVQDLGSPGTWRQRLRDRWLDRSVVLPSNRMTLAEMVGFLREMKRFRALFLHGYGQSIYQLALVLEQHPELRPHLRAISYAAEPVSLTQRTTIESAFGVPLYSFYGTREFGTLGGERPDSEGLHVYPGSVYLEIVRPDGSPVTAGEPGQILVTDLWNWATPLIRYRIGDIGTWVESSAFGDRGLPRIRLVGGREQDLLVTPEGRLVSGSVLATFMSEGIAQVQYLQDEPNQVVIRYVAGRAFTSDSLVRLEQQLRTQVSPDLHYAFQAVHEIPKTSSGKTLVVISQVARQRLAVNSGVLHSGEMDSNVHHSDASLSRGPLLIHSDGGTP